ncbi:MAG TPA: Fe2+-dependent dioxygenase [Burkholderiales bacterium]|nr:Fe2+-dependent dioxygenase [Burkholderiales bacterium]
MLIRIPDVLTREQLAHCRTVLESAEWVDGKITAGAQSAQAKFNLQVPEGAPQVRQLGEIILRALGTNELFNAAALPLRVFPPLFNRYDEGMTFHAHVDNAVRYVSQANIRLRTDIAVTLFLSEPSEYDGGELILEDAYGSQSVKLPAGHMVLYPATSLHRVTPITHGTRRASFFWVQSMVKDDGKRRELFELDRAIMETRGALGDTHHAVIALTGTYHNLLRRWSEL